MKNKENISNENLESFGEEAVKYGVEKDLRKRYDKILSDQKKSKRRKVFNISQIRKIAAVALIFLVSILLFQRYYPTQSLESLAQNYLENTNIPGNQDITRKGQETAHEIQREANYAYQLKNYPLAVSKFEILDSLNLLTPIDQFYLGICQLRSKNYPEAINAFESLDEKNVSMKEEVTWLLSLSYLLHNQKDKAKPLLEQIISTDQFKAKEAKQVLSRME